MFDDDELSGDDAPAPPMRGVVDPSDRRPFANFALTHHHDDARRVLQHRDVVERGSPLASGPAEMARGEDQPESLLADREHATSSEQGGSDGAEVRVVLVDPTDYDPEQWRTEFQKYRQLADFLNKIEIDYQYNRSKTLLVNPNDAFVACSWWTALIAHHAVTDLGQSKFTYFIQEFEPMFYSMGTLSALAQESYTLRHDAIFSTELLREYFRDNRIGVFGELDGDAHRESEASDRERDAWFRSRYARKLAALPMDVGGSYRRHHAHRRSQSWPEYGVVC